MSMPTRQAAPQDRRPLPVARLAGGLLCLSVGAALLWAIVLIAYGSTSATQHLMASMGLAAPLLISAAGQSLVAVGGALLFSGLRKRRGPPVAP